MKVLVTGGSGYLGTHVRRFFNADDYSRSSGRDVLDPEQAAIVGEYDLIIHLAAHLSKSREDEHYTFRTNVEGTVNLLKNVREDAIFIFASTKEVYGRFPDNYSQVNENCQTLYSGQTPLEWSKLIAERYVEYYAHSRHFKSCIFRLSTVYAPVSASNIPNFVGHFAEAINNGEPLALPAKGLPRRDVLHVDDFSAACQAFVDSELRHGLYNLGGGIRNTLTLRELVTKLEEVSGLEAVLDEESELPPPIPMNYVTDLARIDQELGWRPAMKLDDGLRTLFTNS
ncbi:MAG: NAD-dependent epimerase/dehydratase family protein [Pyrinomonadaceae bacterium]